MSVEGYIPDPSVGYEATTAIDANRIVNWDTTASAYPGRMQVKEAGAGEVCFGVSGEAAAAGENCRVIGAGAIGKLVLTDASAILFDSPVESGAAGVAVLATGAGEHQIIGYAMKANGSAAVEIPIRIAPGKITI